MCDHFAVFVIPLNFICNLTLFLKNEFLPFDPWVRGGSADKIFVTMLLHFIISFILMQHDNVLKKFKFDPRVVVGVGSAFKIFSSMLLHFVITFYLICTMNMF